MGSLWRINFPFSSKKAFFYFGQIDGIETLALETMKNFSNILSSTPINTSRVGSFASSKIADVFILEEK
jgi:hypothetical protein